MMLSKILHPINGRDRLNVSRRGGRRLTSSEDSVDTLIRFHKIAKLD